MNNDPKLGVTYSYEEMGYAAIVTVTSINDDFESQYRTFTLCIDEKINWPDDRSEIEVGYWYGGPNPYKFAGGRFYPVEESN